MTTPSAPPADAGPRRAEVAILVGLTVVAVVHQLVLWDWFIEDAAISFAFARNLADGHGFVAYPGGDRVEGFSNPLWTLLLAGFDLLGVDGFASAKPLAALAVAATMPVVWALARRAAPGRVAVPILASAAFAMNPQQAIWGASGLENALWSLLLAVALWRGAAEADDGGAPWSAVAWAGLALTRPEGVAYAAVGLVWAVATGGRWRAWLALFLLPVASWEAFRLAWFAWPLPNTYYAKLAGEGLDLGFASRGWTYVWTWAVASWTLYLAPAVLLAVGGMSRRWIAVPIAVAGLAGLRVLGLALGMAGWPIGWTDRLWLVGLVGFAALAPLLDGGRPGRVAVGSAWHTTWLGVLYAAAVGGDWMDGWRWMSLVAVPLAVVVGRGWVEVVDRAIDGLGRAGWGRVGWGLAAALLGLVVPPAVIQMRDFRASPETTPDDILVRVAYVKDALARLHVDRATVLDVDMGGTMWGWDGPIVDIAGLVDVPIAHHAYEPAFVDDYVFEQRRPEVAHVHGAWAKRLRIEEHPRFEREYVEIPGYLQGETTLHPGNHLRRDLFLAPPPHREPVARFGTVELVDVRVPSDAGEWLYLEVDVRGATFRSRDNWRLLGFISSIWGVHVFDVPPGYDWLPPHRWQDDEVVRMRVAVPLPPDLHVGWWDLGFVVVDGAGAVVPADTPSEEPKVAVGEIRLPEAVRVVLPEANAAVAIADLVTAGDLAEVGECEAAEARWAVARARMAGDRRWIGANRDVFGAAVARCWLLDAVRHDRRADAVEDLLRAKWWDPGVVGYTDAAKPWVEALVQDGRDARELGDWELAFARLDLAARLDPSRAWVRRQAEDARDHRLGLDPDTRARAEARRARAEALSAEGP